MAQIPYEFLVRWDHKTGALKGAHIKYYDDVTLQEGDAQPVAVAGAKGFPLGVILSAVHQGAIKSMDEARAELAVEKAAHEATRQALADKP